LIEITDKALQEFKRILLAEKGGGKSIRIFSAGGGCCGPALGMNIVDKCEERDAKYKNEECAAFIERRAFDELNGTTIEYINDGAQKGFFLRGLHGCC
jgi:iron-sulfur cluster assembly accessory protein